MSRYPTLPHAAFVLAAAGALVQLTPTRVSAQTEAAPSEPAAPPPSEPAPSEPVAPTPSAPSPGTDTAPAEATETEPTPSEETDAHLTENTNPSPAAPEEPEAQPTGEASAPAAEAESPADEAPTAAAEAEPASEEEDTQASGGLFDLLPVELTAFGDIFYRFSGTEPDGFHIGSVELDPALALSPHVLVSAALVYDPDADSFGLGAFTVDNSFAGSEEKHLVRSYYLEDSGIVFGKFDVPFGIAYLQYASTDNRFVGTPLAVSETHGGWNDIGMQAYVIAPHFDLTLYLVNGTAIEGAEADETPDEEAVLDEEGSGPGIALGGRLGINPLPFLSAGVSAAHVDSTVQSRLFGADLSITSDAFELVHEYISRNDADSESSHGLYTQGLARYDVFFGGARWDLLLNGDQVVDRGLAFTLGAEVFPNAEIRVAHLMGLESDTHTTFLQLVGGSSWQPTGLRR